MVADQSLKTHHSNSTEKWLLGLLCVREDPPHTRGPVGSLVPDRRASHLRPASVSAVPGFQREWVPVTQEGPLSTGKTSPRDGSKGYIVRAVGSGSESGFSMCLPFPLS